MRGPRVYHEVDNTYFTAGPGSFINDIYALLKAQNIAAPTGQAFPQLSAEAIIAANPEVIILADEDAGESPQTVAARPGWGQIAAVQNHRVYTVDPDIVSRPGPRLVDALQALARLLYPERFR
jgi:iron complex transport system substrate-binding protein